MPVEQPKSDTLATIAAALSALGAQIQAVQVVVESTLAQILSKSDDAHGDAAAIFDRATAQLESIDLKIGPELLQQHGKTKELVSSLLSRAEMAARLQP